MNDVQNGNNSDWEFKGISRHSMLISTVLSNRIKSIEESLMDKYDLIPTPNQVYEENKELLERIKEYIKEDNNFRSVLIENKSSDLGFPYRMKIEHKNGTIIVFDGISIRSSKIVNDKNIKMEDLLKETGYPSDYDEINDFNECIKKNLDVRYLRYTPYSYYTIKETNWEKIGIKWNGQEGEICLIINDPNRFELFFPQKYVKTGEDFHIYLGNENKIHQRISHDYFIKRELEKYEGYYKNKLEEVLGYRSDLNKDFGGIASPAYKLLKKTKMWGFVKNAVKSLYQLIDYIERGNFLIDYLERNIKENISYINLPPVIFYIGGEKKDLNKMNRFEEKHFIVIRIEENKSISNSPEIKYAIPSYNPEVKNLKYYLESTSKNTENIYNREKDLLTAYQTEFGLYGVWIAIIAIIIAMASLFFR